MGIEPPFQAGSCSGASSSSITVVRTATEALATLTSFQKSDSAVAFSVPVFEPRLMAWLFSAVLAVEPLRASKRDAVDWLRWTYLHRRLAQNPSYYHLDDPSPEAVEAYLFALAESTLEDLDHAGAVEVVDDVVRPATLGMVASYYYLDYKTTQRAALEGDDLDASLDGTQVLDEPRAIAFLVDAEEFAELIRVPGSSFSPLRFATLVRNRLPHGQCKPVCNGNSQSAPRSVPHGEQEGLAAVRVELGPEVTAVAPGAHSCGEIDIRTVSGMHRPPG